MASSKPPIIIIHGFRGAPLGFEDIINDLKTNFEVYAPAIPPFANAGTLMNYTPETYANFIASFIKSHNISKPVLIGHSMGSIIAAATAEKFPELLNDKLIFVSPISARTPEFINRAQPLINVFPNKLTSRITTDFLFIPQHSHKLYKNAVQKTILCGETSSPKKDILAAASFSTSYSVADFSFNKNVLIIAGDRDRIMPKKKTTTLAKSKNFNLKIIKKTGHVVNYEKPQELSQIIREFLSQ